MSKTRSIFEDVSEKAAAPAAAPKARRPQYARRGIAIWLAILFALVTAMIVVGGMTRLTDSGLSITEWKPVTGAVPPMDAASWDAEFERYKQIPQYELLNPEMTLAEFKVIYWWEWGHRQLGRIIGLVWAVGFVGFLVLRRIPPGWTPRLLGLGVLGGLQGAIGWWMVSSGLSGQMIAVASYRLAVHLGLAFAILGLIAWYFLRLVRSEADLLQSHRQRNPLLMRWGLLLTIVAFLQILLGALVAGIDAGRGYIDWPLMGGEVFPSDAFNIVPAWRNFLENPALVQFNHRLLGYVLATLGALAWWRSRKSSMLHIRRAFDAMGIALAVQVVLGVVTVLHASPWQIAIVHQLGAIVLFVLILRAKFTAQFPLAQKIARGGGK
ncbi:heme A synthase [Amaricoccus macauensis]|uniref:heme A synthase n=1 Tax=Amaricoccus macauensis TaxID=57001 RepID=UPI003C7A6F0D